MRRYATILASSLMLALIVAACGDPPQVQPDEEVAGETDGAGGGETDGAGGGETEGGQQERWDLSVATGTTGGVYFPVGGAMAEIFSRNLEHVTASAEATGASVENLRLVAGGQSELALAQGDVVYDAYHARDQFSDDPIETRVLMVLYPNVYHAVSLQEIHADLGLDCFGDVEGHRFSVGAPGSGNEHATNLVFQAIGLSFDDISVQRYAYAETARALREGQLDAGSWVVGEGHGTLRELEATDPVHLIEICDDELAAVLDTYPFYTEHTIEGGTYSTVTDDVDTIALWNVVVVPTDFPDDLAYDLVSAIYDNVSFIEQVYEPGARYFTPETLEHSPVPLHPGTIRYAEEQGVDVADELRP